MQQSLLLIKTFPVASDWRNPEESEQLIEKTEAEEARDNKTFSLKKFQTNPFYHRSSLTHTFSKLKHLDLKKI